MTCVLESKCPSLAARGWSLRRRRFCGERSIWIDEAPDQDLLLIAAIGVAGMTSIVIVASSASLQDQSVRAGIDPSTSTEVARSIAAGATSEDASSVYAVPVADVTEIDDFRRQAYLVRFRAHGLVGGAITMAATVMFFAVRRRQERTSPQ